MRKSSLEYCSKELRDSIRRDLYFTKSPEELLRQHLEDCTSSAQAAIKRYTEYAADHAEMAVELEGIDAEEAEGNRYWQQFYLEKAEQIRATLPGLQERLRKLNSDCAAEK